MSSSFTSSRSRSHFVAGRFVAGPLLCMTALAFSGAACVNAHIISTGIGGTDGQGGAGDTGTGGSDTGGAAGGDTGAGGTATGGAGGIGTGGTGAGGMAAGGSGMGGNAGAGAGGAIVDAGAGGMIVDAPYYDGPPPKTPTTAGQVVITEIMVNPNAQIDDLGEWFELYNPSSTDAVDLMGCTFKDSSNSNQDGVQNHLVILPNAFATFGRFGDAATGGFVPDLNYHVNTSSTTDVKFGNGGDLLIVQCNGGTMIDEVNFTTWVIPAGATLSLDPSHYNATDNDVQTNWCPAVLPPYHTVGGVTDNGTPGVSNPPCH